MNIKTLLGVLVVAIAGALFAIYCNMRIKQALIDVPAKVRPVAAVTEADKRIVDVKEHSIKPTPSQRLPNLIVSESVRKVTVGGLGKTPKEDHMLRMNALKTLGKDLAGGDIDEIYRFIRSKPEDHPILEYLMLNSMKNELMDLILSQANPPLDVCNLLVEIANDPEQDEVNRDYCIQHFRNCYDVFCATNRPGIVNPEQQMLMDAYWKAIDGKEKCLPATALLGVEYLSREHNEIDRKVVGEKALNMAKDYSMSGNARATALQVCTQMGLFDALPLARVESQSGDVITLRMAAIASLGDMGNNEDVKLLETLSADTDERIKISAQSALKRLGKSQTAK